MEVRIAYTNTIYFKGFKALKIFLKKYLKKFKYNLFLKKRSIYIINTINNWLISKWVKEAGERAGK